MRSGAKRGVLIVDDLDDTRELLAELFMHLGYHSIMARNGAEALARLREVRPDVVVTDLMMDGMGGAELVQRMDTEPATKGIPVVLVTGSGREKALAALGPHARQVSAILTKPVKLADLQQAVEAALSDEPR